MRELVNYILRPLVSHPDEVQVTDIEGSASLLLELRMHPDDVNVLKDNEGQFFRAIQQVLSAAGGSTKPILELVEDDDSETEE